jgi:hypothetical protein
MWKSHFASYVSSKRCSNKCAGFLAEKNLSGQNKLTAGILQLTGELTAINCCNKELFSWKQNMENHSKDWIT